MSTALDHKNRGNTCFSAGQYEEAIKEFTSAINLDSENHILYSNRSAAYAGLKNFNLALDDANKCIQLNKNFVKGYSRKGLALFNLKKYDEAKNVYEEGLKLDANNEQLKEGLNETNNALKGPADPAAGLGKMFGPDMFAKLAANPKTAKLLSNPATVNKLKMLQTNPQAMATAFQDPDLMQCISVLLGIDMSGAPGGAAGDEPFAATAPPQNASKPAASSSAFVSEDTSDEDEPVKPAYKAPEPKAEPKKAPLSDEEKKLAETKKKAEDIKNKGNELYKKKNFDEAIALYNEAIEVDPKNFNFILNRAAANFEKKDFESAKSDCNLAMEKARENFTPETSTIIAKAYARLGNIYAKTNELDLSIQSYNKSLIENNSYEVRQKLKEVENLKKKLEEKNYIDPVKSNESNELGKESFKNGKFPEAIAHYSEAIKRNPTDAKLYANRAACYVKLMTWGNAMDDCDHCIKLDPTYVKAYIRKGKIQHCIKEFHKALSTFEEAAKLDPHNEDLAEARRATQIAISEANSSGQVDPERQKRAMEDPEIQAILSDPLMNKILQDLSTNPKGNQAALKDPKVRANLEKLIAAGIIRTG